MYIHLHFGKANLISKCSTRDHYYKTSHTHEGLQDSNQGELHNLYSCMPLL